MCQKAQLLLTRGNTSRRREAGGPGDGEGARSPPKRGLPLPPPGSATQVPHCPEGTAQREERRPPSADVSAQPQPRGLQALALSCSLTFTPSPLNRLRPSGAGLARLIPPSGPLHSNASCLECPVPRPPHGWLLLIFRHLFKCDPLREPSLTTPRPKSLPRPITLFLSIRPCHLGSFYWDTFNKHHADGHFFHLSSPVTHLHTHTPAPWGWPAPRARSPLLLDTEVGSGCGQNRNGT